MKPYLSLIAAFIIWTSLGAQESEPKKPDLRKIFDLLQSGNSEEAYGQAVALMGLKGLDSSLTPKLLNFRITALAQMFIASKISYEDLKTQTQKIPLGPISLTGHKFRTSGSLNCITREQEDSSRLFLAESNQDGTYIYTMFTIKPKPGQVATLSDGNVYFISGNLASLSFHPYGRGTYVFKAIVEDAVVMRQ